jgi:RNA polymerase sigma-70 factor (ECF subfamily)
VVRDFDRFYEAHRDEIGRALALVLGDETLGLEAVDEAMLQAYQQWSKVATMESPAGWVFVVGKRWGLSWRRRRRREHKREEAVAVDGFGSVQPDEPTSDYLTLMAALRHLNDKHRTVVVCRFFMGLSVGETAELLSIEPGTVKSRLSRALHQLQPLIEEGR